MSTYLRICDELLPWFDELAFGQPDAPRVDTIHRHILGTIVEFIPWSLIRPRGAEDDWVRSVCG